MVVRLADRDDFNLLIVKVFNNNATDCGSNQAVAAIYSRPSASITPDNSVNHHHIANYAQSVIANAKSRDHKIN